MTYIFKTPYPPFDIEIRDASSVGGETREDVCVCVHLSVCAPTGGRGGGRGRVRGRRRFPGTSNTNTHNQYLKATYTHF